MPVYSVDTEEEARKLLVTACETNIEGEFIARELVQSRTLESLAAFGKRLAKTDAMMKRNREKRKQEEGV